MDKQQSVEFAQKLLQDIVSFFGENITVNASLDDDAISLHIESSEINSILIGRNAETLKSFQYLLSTALRNKNAEISWVKVDVADYNKQHEEKIIERARGWIEEVRQTGQPYEARISAFDRRLVHQVATEYDDVETASEGEGRERRIIISKKDR